ncbi:MAG TPA: ornithine cyclodeaminase family protein [Pirellulales bacterium]|jgi:ornithine cyclodeaminase/alanine dehydrogenase-like protein (mu-crystallin family)|nr:ornithine cyclodeaminase family protein [Pirellulales bacterium]
MAAIFLSEADVQNLLDMPTAIAVVEASFRHLALREAQNAPRFRVAAKGIVLHTMSAAAEYLRVVGWKTYATTKQGAHFLAGLYGADNGELLALLQADRLGQLRTGATTGVAAQWLSSADISELGLIGAGWQAETQLQALACVRPLKRAYVYSRRQEQREEFAARMSERLNLEVIAVDRPKEAVADLPIVITATNSPEPVLDGEWLAEGALVCAMGSNWRGRAELDVTAIRRADNIVCDSVECCRNEAGDFTAALEKGIFDWSRAVDLCDIVTAKAIGRHRGDSVVIFKSVGMAIEDVALGAKLLELAKAAGAGVTLPF